MPIEIERKFLLVDDSWRAAVSRSERLVQGYLGGERCSVRVRIEGDRANLNIKSRVAGMARSEYEYPIPVTDAEALLAEFCERAIDKVRHHVTFGGKHFEIDEFAGANAGLVMCEIELGSVDETFERPAWLGAEVTDDVRYYNAALVERPWSSWAS
jgi:adenylate cyclase